MPGKRKIRGSPTNSSSPLEQIKKVSDGLYYVSDTDAEILPFVGAATDAVTKECILSQIGDEADAPVVERSFEEFFARLTKIQDWFGDEEKRTAAKFAALKELLEDNLKDLKVFKVGRIEIDIYAVGLDKEGKLMGIRTQAVETL